ncbi:hypothetical protein MPC1_4100001 [Methylocella tundrae]|nr:hypothetical protein MPC1_4100001 [Methylocella tundrae]
MTAPVAAEDLSNRDRTPLRTPDL